MTQDQMFKILAEFFMDTFREDATGVGEWLASGGQDVDEFYEMVKQYQNNS